MKTQSSLHSSQSRFELVAVILTNILPVVGVAFFGWSLAAIVLLYWLELGVMLVSAAIRALFAQLPPQHPSDGLLLGATRNKRGGLSIPLTDLRIQVAHIPVLVVSIPVFGLVWMFTGAIGFAGLEQVSVTPAEQNSSAGLAIVGIVVGRSIETFHGYFLAGRHREVNAQMALWTAVWPILVVGTALVVGGLGVAAGAPPVVVLVGVVGGKFVLELAGVYSDLLAAFDERTSLSFGWATDPPERSSIDETLTHPVRVVRPYPVCVLLGGFVCGITSPVMALPVLIGVVAVITTLASGDATLLPIFGGAAIGLIGILSFVGMIDWAVRYLSVEYRIGNDAIGYDRILGEPQWRVPGWKLDAADRRQTLVDRLFGTETVVVSHEDRTIRLPSLERE